MNRWSRQGRRFGLVTGIIVVLLLSACGGSSTGSGNGNGGGTTQLKIMVGGLSKQIYLPNMLTQQLGYFKQEGLDVTLIDEASGQSSENEVLAGQVDAGSGSYNHTIELQAAGKQMEAVVLLNVPCCTRLGLRQTRCISSQWVLATRLLRQCSKAESMQA